jgi:hypothetical protein
MAESTLFLRRLKLDSQPIIATGGSSLQPGKLRRDRTPRIRRRPSRPMRQGRRPLATRLEITSKGVLFLRRNWNRHDHGV